VPSVQVAGGPSRPPLLYSLSERQWRVVDGVVAFFGCRRLAVRRK
jgi:hypothetical protein